MSDRYFLIAAPTTAADLAEAVFAAWPEHERVAGPEQFESAPALDRGDEPLVIRIDGGWAVLNDLTGARQDAEGRLAALGKRYDRLICLAHQDSVGFFQFLLFERGALVRKKSVIDGRHVSLGTPLPMEARAEFGEDEPAELNALWRSFALDNYWTFWERGPFTVFRFGERASGCLWPFGPRSRG